MVKYEEPAPAGGLCASTGKVVRTVCINRTEILYGWRQSRYVLICRVSDY